MTDEAKIQAALALVQILGDTIRELGRVPSGHLYVRVMQYMSVSTYDGAINSLKNAGLVEEKNHELIWKGPAK